MKTRFHNIFKTTNAITLNKTTLESRYKVLKIPKKSPVLTYYFVPDICEGHPNQMWEKREGMLRIPVSEIYFKIKR